MSKDKGSKNQKKAAAPAGQKAGSDYQNSKAGPVKPDLAPLAARKK